MDKIIDSSREKYEGQKPYRFFEWNYDTRIVVEWARGGECNGCGACCRSKIKYLLRRPMGRNTENPGMMGRSPSDSGIWFEVRLGRKRRFISEVEVSNPEDHPSCYLLSEENKCVWHEFKDFMKDRMSLCDSWPLHPDQVKAFEECSYTFEKIGEWSF